MATRPPVFSYPADPNDPLREELRRGITLPGDTFRRALAPQVRPAPALPADGDERPAWRRVLDTIQAPLNTTGAGFGAVVGGIAGLFGSDAYERAVARRADEYGIGPDADLVDSLAIAPGPGTVLAEALAPGRPETAAGRIAKNVGSMAGDIVGDPANWIAGGLAGARALGSFARTGVRDVGRMAPALGNLSRGTDEVVNAVRAARSITRTEAGKQALGQFLGSATAGLVYAPDIAIGTVDSLRAAKDAYDRGDFDTAAEMAVQAGLMGGIGGLTLHGVRSEAEALRRPPRVPQPMVDTIDLVDRLVAEQSGRPRGTVFQGEIPEPPFVAASEPFSFPPPDVWDGTAPPPPGSPGAPPDMWSGRPPVMPWIPDVWDGPGPDEGGPALPLVWPGPTQGGHAPGGAALAPEQAFAERAFLRPDMDAATAAEMVRRAREWRRAQSLEAQIEDMADRIASGEFAAMAERGEEPSPEDLQFRLNNADAISEALRVRQERAFLRPDPEAAANAETARLAREHLRDRAEAERPISVGRVEELDAPIGPTRIFGADAERPGKLQDPVLEAMLQERWENQRFPLQQLQARADARFEKDSKGLDNEQLQRLAGDTGVASDPLDRLLIENAHGLRVMRDHERRPDGGMRSWKEGSPFEDVPEGPTEIIRAVAEDRDNPLYLKAREAAARWMDDKEIGDAVDFEAADADTSFDPDALEAQAGAPTLLTRPESGIDSLQPYQPPKTPLDELIAQRLAANAARAEAERGGFGPGRVPALSDEGTVDLADVRGRMEALRQRREAERRADMDAEMRMLDEGGMQPVTPQQPAIPDAVRPAAPAPSDRRAEPDLRARVDQFIENNPNASREALRAEVERLRAELDTDALTRLGSARAMERSEQTAGGIAAFDLAGLKWVNDTFGHDAGDEILRAAGQAFRDAGVPGFRKSGDEFFLHAKTPEAAAEAARQVQERLSRAEIKLKLPDGTERVVSGLRIDFGTGANRGEADSALYAGREAALASGERSPRGERPAGFFDDVGKPASPAVRAPEGDEAGQRDAPAEAVAAPEPSAEPEVRGWRPATQSAEDIKAAIRSGATARVVTATRVTVLDAKALARFEKAGGWMLRDAPSNTGRPAYRLQTGKSSVFLLPGQLQVDRAIPAPEPAPVPEAPSARSDQDAYLEIEALREAARRAYNASKDDPKQQQAANDAYARYAEAVERAVTTSQSLSEGDAGDAIYGMWRTLRSVGEKSGLTRLGMPTPRQTALLDAVMEAYERELGGKWGHLRRDTDGSLVFAGKDRLQGIIGRWKADLHTSGPAKNPRESMVRALDSLRGQQGRTGNVEDINEIGALALRVLDEQAPEWRPTTAATPAPHDTRTPEAREGEVTITFPKKPAVAVRKGLKAAGFKWDDTRGAWVAPKPVADANAATVRAAAARGGVVRGMGEEAKPAPAGPAEDAPPPTSVMARGTEITVAFDGHEPPPKDVVDGLKAAGFKWDPNRGMWVGGTWLRTGGRLGKEFDDRIRAARDNGGTVRGLLWAERPAAAEAPQPEPAPAEPPRVEPEQRDPDTEADEPDEMLDADVPPEDADAPAAAAELVDAPGVKAGTADLIERITAVLDAGGKIDNPTLTRLADEAFGGTRGQGKHDPRDAYDALEAAVNARLADEAPRLMEGDGRQGLEELRSLLRQLPRQDDRTTEQVELQQFSTPPTQAFVAARAAKIRPGEVVLEPSAGVGGLATFARAAGGEVVVNEIAPRRGGLLQMLGFEDRHSVDAELLDDLLPDDVRPSLVIMNPPFSATGGRVQRNNTEFGARHITQALRRLEPGGRLVAIVGEGMKFPQQGASGGRGATGAAFADWWADIMREFNVRANLGIPGDEYGKYGTTFPNQILVIDKTGPTPGGQYAERVKHVRFGLVKNLEEALDALERIDRPAEGAERPGAKVQPDARGDVGQDVGGPSGRAGGRQPEQAGVAGGRGGARAGGVRNRPGAEPPASPEAAPSGEPAGARPGSTAGSDAEVGARPDRPGAPERAPAGDAGDDRSRPVEIDLAEPTAREEGSDGYVPYVPAKVRAKGAKKHPAKIVEPPSMAAVDPPDPTYTPKLPASVLEEGRLSDLQYEAVVYAGQRHAQTLPDGSRGGFFVGDGTGVGKGREIAGIIYDNWLQGRRKALWVSFNNELLGSAARDIDAVAGKGAISLHELSKVAKNADVPISARDGVVFTTYSSLSSSSKAGKPRLDQIKEWLGEDGVIVFDEAHKAKNAMPMNERGEPSQMGAAVVSLQAELPKARVVYVSATGATDVANMAYMTRLGLWAPGRIEKAGGKLRPVRPDAVLAAKYPFGDFRNFVNEIENGGVGAKEVVSRDLKALGAYTSRSISFEGVEYREVPHAVEGEQAEQYDTGAEAWRIVMNNIDKALELTNSPSNVRRNAMTRFWGSHQRFFKTLTTALKIPTAIREAEAALDRGESVVLSLLGTQEGKTGELVKEAIAEGGSLEDISFSPAQLLIDYVDKAFPTQQFTEVSNPDNPAETIRVAAVDADGKPVQSKEALRMKQALMDKIAAIRFADNPLDQIINHFGVNNVAELTGRKRRLIVGKDGKREWAKRGGDGVAQDKVNEHEMNLFQDGKKRVAVITQAASTGISLHADNSAKNKQRRHMILVELDWSADQAMQRMGRVHRSNQTTAPIYTLLTSDIGGERRFASTIARRLESLGALTKGERSASQAGELAKYNFETKEGQAALEAVVTAMSAHGLGYRIPGLDDPGQALVDMGLIPKADHPVMKFPDVPRFFNRLLGLDKARQNAVFDAFMVSFRKAIENAKRDGSFDAGVADLKGTAIRVKSEPVTVHKDEITGALTQHVTLEVDRPVPKVQWNIAKRLAEPPQRDMALEASAYNPETRRSEVVRAGFYKQNRSGHVVVVEAVTSRTDARTGAFHQTVQITQPRGRRTTTMPLDEFVSRYSRIEAAEAEGPWKEGLEQVPATETTEEHLISGAILPLWKSMQEGQKAGGSKMRVVRAKAEDGRRFVGLRVPTEDVGRVLQSLGIDRGLRSPEDVFKAVSSGETVGLQGGLNLRNVRIHNQPRIELAGVKPNEYEKIRQIKGIIEERIRWDTRFFIPTFAEDGIPVLARVLEARPVLAAEKPPVTREMARRAAPGQRGMFAEDVPLPEPKRPEPKQGALFGGRDMLVPSAARTTEGREADGPLFRQEQDARDRAEERSQASLLDDTTREQIREESGPEAIDRVREGDKRGARAGQFIVASPDFETRVAAKKVAATLGRNFLPALDRAFRGLAKAAGVDRAKLLGLTLDRRVTANVTGNAVRLNLFAARADSSVERGLYHAAVHELAHIVTEQRAKADPAFAARLDDGGHGDGYAEVLAELQAKLRPERRGWLRTIGAALSAEDGRARKMIDETWQADVAPAWRLIRAREAGRGGPRGLGRPRGDGDGAGEGGPRSRARDAAGGAAGGVRSGEPVRGGRVEAASGVRPGASVQRGGPEARPAVARRQDSLGYYSALREAVDGAREATATGEQWAGILRNTPGVKPDEMKWTGLDDYLRENAGKALSREDVASVVEEGQPLFMERAAADTRELRRRQRADAPEGPAAEAAGVVGRMRRNRRATGARWIAELRRRGVDHDPLFRWLDQRGTVRVTRDEILAYLDPVDRPRTEPGHPSGEPPMVGERVESMREAERAVDAPPAELDRQTRANWSTLDASIRSMLRTMNDADFYGIMESRRLNDAEVQAWAARVAGKKERAEAAAEALATARAEGGDTLEAERAHLEATMDYIRAERAMVNDGTGAARALAARRRLMQASRLDNDEFLRSLFRDLPNASDAQVADIVRAWRTDPQAVPDLLRAAIGYDTLDKALEVWKAGLLSAPSTDIANLTGNAGEAGARIAEGVVAAGVDRLLSMFGGTTRARRLEEAGAEVAGLIDVFPGAASKLLADLKGVVKDGDRWFPDKQIGASGRWERDVGAVGGVGGRLARTSFRKLDVEDQFFKTLTGAGVLRKLAMRRARQALGEAASAEAVRARAAEIVEEALSPTSPRHADLLQEVEKEKLSRTFQDDPGRLGSDLIRLARDNRLVAVIFPFIKTPANILKVTLQRSPLGYGEAKRRYDVWRKAIAEGAGAAEVRRLQGEAADAIARPLLGTTLLAGFAALAQAGVMTGGGPTDSNEERLLRDSGWQPYSFVFRDGEGRRYYVPYNRFEPVSTIFGYAADLIEIKDEKKAGDMLDKAVGSLAANLVNKTYLQGLSDAANLIAKPSQFASRYLSNLTGSLVPNIVARAARGIDPALRDTTPEKTGLAGIPERATKTVLSRIPGLTGLVPERASALGDPVRRQGSTFSRFGLPVQMSVEEPGSLERELLAADYAPQAPGRDVTINRQRVRLTDEEYDILLRYRRAAAARVGEIVKMGSFQRRPEDDRRRVLQGVFRDYGDRAREQAKARARARLARERSVRPAQPTAGV